MFDESDTNKEQVFTNILDELSLCGLWICNGPLAHIVTTN